MPLGTIEYPRGSRFKFWRRIISSFGGYNLGMKDDFQNLVVQVVLCGVIFLVGNIVLGVVFVGWVLIWKVFQMFF